MSLHALAVISAISFFFIMSLAKHPFWGVLGYIFLYYNSPSPEINWWAHSLPQLRWSFFAAAIILVSLFLHNKEVNGFGVAEMLNLRWFLVLAILMILLLPSAVNGRAAPEKVYDFVRYLIVFVFIVKSVPDMNRFEILVWLILLCCLNLSWDAYIHPEYRHHGRLEGIGTPDSTDANMFASVLVAFVPFLIREVLFENWRHKIVVAGMSVFILNAIILCSSRGAFVSLVAMGSMLVVMENDRKAKKKIIVVLVAAVVVFISLLDPVYIERLLSVHAGGDATGAGRTEIWGYGWMMSRQNPLGVGGDGFRYLSPQFMPESLLTGGVRSPHNTYLKVLVEQGWLGLVLYLAAWGCTLRMLHRIRRKIQTFTGVMSSELVKISQYSLSVEAAIIGLLVCGIFVDRLYFELSYILAAMAAFLFLYGSKLLNENGQSGSNSFREELKWR